MRDDLSPRGPLKRLPRLTADHRNALYRVLANDAANRAESIGPVVGMAGEETVAPVNGSRIVSVAAWVVIAGIALLGYLAKS